MGFEDSFSALRGEQGASHMLDVYFNDLKAYPHQNCFLVKSDWNLMPAAHIA